jgi:hypothetical protein
VIGQYVDVPLIHQTPSHPVTPKEALVRDIIRGGAIVYGLLAAGFSILMALALILLRMAGNRDDMPALMAATVIASIIAVGCGIGLPLALAGWRSLQGRASPRLVLPSIWLVCLLFVACLGLGTVVIHIRAASILLLPPLHVITSALPALILLAAVLPSLQSGGAGLTRRSFVALFAYGSLLSTVVAITLEGIAATVAMAMAFAALSVLPGGQTSLVRLVDMLQSPALLSSPERLLDVLVTPALVLGIGLLVAVATPLIEETVKSLGAWTEGALLGRLRRSQAFALGIIAGCGFSFVEALFYGGAGLPHAWASLVLTRSATTVIHATATGLVALGWYEVWRGKPWRSIGYLAAGIGLHGIWNGAAGLSAVAGLQLFGENAAAQGLEIGLAALAGLMLVVTFVTAIAALAAFTLRLRQEEPVAV